MNWRNEQFCLRKGEIIRNGQTCRRIVCHRGRLWITQTGLPQDVILVAGQSFEPRQTGLLLIEALEDASLEYRATTTTLDFTTQAQEWLSAWNAHDLERILAHYAEDVELTSPFVAKLTGQSDGIVRGKAALRDYFVRGLQAHPALRFDFVRLYPGVRSCVLEYHSLSGLRTAELMEFDERGKVRRVLAHYHGDAPGISSG